MSKYYPLQSFYDLVDKMALSDLEDFIVGLSENQRCNSEKIGICLRQRQCLLRDKFECTAENVARFGQVMLLLKERSKMLLTNAQKLYIKMHRQWQEDAETDFPDFAIEAILKIGFTDQDDVLELIDDTESKYAQMAEIIYDYYDDNWGGDLMEMRMDYNSTKAVEEFEDINFNGSIDYQSDFDDGDWGEGWFLEQFPELSKFPITHAAHRLLFHSNYALQDIIRANAWSSEIKITYQSYIDTSGKPIE